MLLITVPATEPVEMYNEETNEFFYTKAEKEQTLQLEHSLLSLSKWESKWCKIFFSKEEKTHEETIDYIRCMVITPNVGDDIINRLSKENIETINNYIQAPMTATTFRKEQNAKPNRERITSELVYYWMFSLGIPKECEKWHLNRLLTLIRVFNVKNQPPKKMSKRDLMSRNAALNAARRKQLNSNG